MTLNGKAYAENNTRHDVVGDQWQILSILPEDHHHASGRMAFWVTGVVGEFSPSGYNTTQPDALYAAHISLGLVNASGGLLRVLDHYTHLVPMGDTRYWAQNPTGLGAGVPWQFLAVFDDAPAPPDPIYGTRLPAGTRLAVVARIWPLGDPSVAGASAGVWNVSALTWWLSELGSTRYLCEHFSPATPASNGQFPSAMQTFQSAANPLDEGTWLVFWTAQYWPSASGSAPLFRLKAAVGGGPFEPLTGSDERFGLEARRNVDLVRGWQSHFCHGAHAPVDVPTGQQAFVEIDGGDHFSQGPGNATRVVRTRFLAVKVSTLVNFRVDRESRYVRSVSDPGVPAGFPFELVSQQAVDWVVLFNAVVRPPAVMMQGLRTYAGLVDGTSGPFVHLSAGGVSFGNTKEGAPVSLQWSAPVGRTPTGQAPVGDRFLVRQWSVFTPYGDLLDMGDVSAAAFYLEDDPSNLPGVAVPPTEFVDVVPTREAVETGSLDPLPESPDAQRSEELVVSEALFEGELGHRWRRPLFVGASATWQFQVSGLVLARRDALMNFLRTRGAFRWTPPGRSEAAFAVSTRPRATASDHRTWTVSWAAYELTWTGS